MDPTSPWSNYSPHYSCLRGTGNPAVQQGQLGMPPSLPRQDQMAGYAAAAPHPWLLSAHHGLGHQSQPADSGPMTSAPVIHGGYDSTFLSSTFQPSSKGHFAGLSHGSGFFKPLGKDPEISDLRSGFGHCVVGPSPLSPDPGPSLSPGSGGLYNTWRHAGMIPTSGAGPFGVLPHETVVPATKSSERCSENFSKENKTVLDHTMNHHKYRGTVVPSPSHPSASYLDPGVSRTSLTQQNQQPYFAGSVTESVSDTAAARTNFCTYASNSPQAAVSRPSTTISQNYFTSSFSPVAEKRDSVSKQNGIHCVSDAYRAESASGPFGMDARIQNMSTTQATSTGYSPHYSRLPSGAEGAYASYDVESAYDLSQPPFAVGQSPVQHAKADQEYDFGGNVARATSHAPSAAYPPMSTPAPASTPAYPTPPSIDQAQVPTAHSQEDPGVAYSSVITRVHAPVSNSPVYSGPSSFHPSSKSVLVIKKDNLTPETPCGADRMQPYREPTMSLDRNSMTPNVPPLTSHPSSVKYTPMDQSSGLQQRGPCTPTEDPSIRDMMHSSPSISSTLNCSTVPQMSSNMLSPCLPIRDDVQDLPNRNQMSGQRIPIAEQLTTPAKTTQMGGDNTPYERVILKISRKRERGKRGRPRKHHVVESCTTLTYRTEFAASKPQDSPCSSSGTPGLTATSESAMTTRNADRTPTNTMNSYSLQDNPASIPVMSRECTSMLPGSRHSHMPESAMVVPSLMERSELQNMHHNIPVPYSAGKDSSMHVSSKHLMDRVGTVGVAGNKDAAHLEVAACRKKSLSSTIEDDLGFLANLPHSYGPESMKNKEVAKSKTQDGFLKSFLHFLEETGPKDHESEFRDHSQNSKRGKLCGGPSKSKEATASKSSGTEADVDSDLRSEKAGRAAEGCEEGSGCSKNLVSPGDDAEGGMFSTGKEVMVPNPEAPSFSSEEDEEVATRGIASSIAVALQQLSEREASGSEEEDSGNSDSNSSCGLTNSGHLSTGNDEASTTGGRSSAGGGKRRGRGRKRRQAGVEAAARGKRARRRSATGQEGDSDPDEENENGADSAKDESSDGEGSTDKVTQGSPPRRTSMRKCKEQVIKKQQEKRERRSQRLRANSTDNEDPATQAKEDEEDEEDYRLSDFDSDCDPAWTPRDKDPEKTGEEVRPRVSRRGRKKSGPLSRKAAGSKGQAQADSDDGSSKEKKGSKKQAGAASTSAKNAAPGSAGGGDSSAAYGSNSPYTSDDGEKKKPQQEKGAANPATSEARFVREGYFKTGDFVVGTEERNEDEPQSLWRIEGKSLIQRFEPFDDTNGERVYRNTSSYSSWNPSIRFKYSPVTIRYITCNRTNMVVKYLGVTPSVPSNAASPLSSGNSSSPGGGRAGIAAKQEANGASEWTEGSTLREHFEIFLQTLVSQALDPNFITEIMKEKDEYFLCHLNAMESLASEKKMGLTKKGNWEGLKKPFEKFPSIDVSPVLDQASAPTCQICSDAHSTQVIKLSGFAYDETSLSPCDMQVKAEPSLLRFSLCDTCTEAASLYSQLHHQKYNFYSRCRDKVDSVRAGDESRPSHIILEQCLQDIEWVNQMFQEIETVWKACEKLR